MRSTAARTTRGILLCLLVLGAWSASATTYYVDPSRPDNSGTCTSEATACQTILGGSGSTGGGWVKLQSAAGCGHTLRLRGRTQRYHRMAEGIQADKECSASSPITIACYDCDPADATTLPIITGSTLTTASQWSVHSGSNCEAATPSECVWRMDTTINPGRMVFQNSENPPVVQRNGDVITTAAETDWATPMHNKWAEAAQSAAECPSALTKRYQFCWAANRLYLRSRGKPTTVFTEPGVEVLQMPGNQGSALFRSVAKSGYVLQDVIFRHGSNRLLRWDMTAGSVTSITIRNVQAHFSAQREALFGSDYWANQAEGAAAIWLEVHNPHTLSGLLVDGLVVDNPGRDAFDISKDGKATGTINKLWMRNVFNHGTVYLWHDCERPTGPLCVRNITLDQPRWTDVCQGASGNPANTNEASTITWTRFLFENPVESDSTGNTDPRLPTNRNDAGALVLAEECRSANGQALWTSDAQVQHIWRRGLVIGDSWERTALIQHANTLTMEHVTAHGPRQAGFSSTGNSAASGRLWTLNRSVLTDMPCCSSGSSPMILSTVQAPSGDYQTAAGDWNAIRNAQGSDQVGWIGSARSMQQWKDSTQTSGDQNTKSLHASSLSQIYANHDAHNFTPALGSPLICTSSENCPTTAPCVGKCERGAFEVVELATGSTPTATTWHIPVQMAYPPVVVHSPSCAVPIVNGVRRTGTLAQLNDTTVALTVTGSPAPPAGVPLQVEFATGCLKDSLNLGNTPAFTNQNVLQTVTIQNTISGSAPTPIDCSVSASAPDDVLVRWTANGSPMLPATGCTGFQVDDTAQFTSPETIAAGSCTRSGTDHFVLDRAATMVAGEAVWVRYQTSGNVSNTPGLEPAAVTFPQCRNDLVAGGDIWYVRQSGGNNGNSCTAAKNPATAKLTIAAGLGCLEAGGTLDIGAGTYNERIALPGSPLPSGRSWSQPTTLRATPGATVVWRPTGPGELIRFGNGSALTPPLQYVVIEGFVIDMRACTDNCRALTINTNSGDDAGNDSVSHIRYQRNDINITGACGVAFVTDNTSRDVQILDNVIYGMGTGAADCESAAGGTPGSHGFYWRAWEGIIRGNDVFGGTGYGIQVYTSGGTIEIVGNVIENNRFHRMGKGGILLGSTSKNTMVRNNLVLDNAGLGISVGGSSNAIYHNTVVSNDGQAIQRTNGGALSNPSLATHNIFYQNSLNSYIPPNNFTANPLFVTFSNDGDPTNDDLHLQSTSAARDAIACVPDVPTDTEGVIRPQPSGGPCDYGAYEVGGVPPTDTSPPLILSCDPPDVRTAPSGTVYPAGTTEIVRSCTTNEPATCRIHGSCNLSYDGMGAGGDMTAVGNVHTRPITVTDGITQHRYIRCKDTAGNVNQADLCSGSATPPGNGVKMSYSVALPAPEVTACHVENATPTVVRCLMSVAGAGPLSPASGCTGWTGSKDTGQGPVDWPFVSCVRTANQDGMDLTFSGNATYGNVLTVTYTAETAVPVTNANGQELEADTFVVNNQVTDQAPVLTDCVVENTATTTLLWSFIAHSAGTMTPASNCTGTSATLTGSPWTQTDCDLVSGSVNQFRTLHTPAAAQGQEIRAVFTPGSGGSTIKNGAGIEAAVTPTNGLLCRNNVGAPPPAPTLTSLRTPAAAPTTVVVLIGTEAPPLLPSTGCVGLSCLRDRHLGQGPQPWVSSSCTLSLPNTQVLTMTDPLVFGDTYTCSYTTQAAGEAGRIRDTNGTQLAAFTDAVGSNLLNPPVVEGTVSMINAQVRRSGVEGQSFTPGETVQDCGLNTACSLPEQATVQMFLEVQCGAGEPCAPTGFRIEGCDSGVCNAGNHDDSGWYALPNADASGACGSRYACLGTDPTVVRQSATAGCLSGQTRDFGVYLARGDAGATPVGSLGPQHCAQYVAVVKLGSLAVHGQTVKLRVARSDGQRLAAYPVGDAGVIQVTGTGKAFR